MVKFRYTGDSSSVSVGVAGALFHKGVVNEVPDERLAALLRTTNGFEEVSADQLPPVTSAILHAPTQGALHPDPEVAEFIRQKHLKGSKHKTLEGVDSPGDGLGQINRADQYEANLTALSGSPGEVTEVSGESGGEEVIPPKKSGKKAEG
jgi:hypothetical protein